MALFLLETAPCPSLHCSHSSEARAHYMSFRHHLIHSRGQVAQQANASPFHLWSHRGNKFANLRIFPFGFLFASDLCVPFLRPKEFS